MKIKDIVNRDIVNLTNCDQEPIRIPGSIQPHGFLLGISQSGSIEYCSANTAEYLAKTPQELLGQSFSDIFGPAQQQAFEQYIAQNLMLSSSALKLSFADTDFCCRIHQSEAFFVLEAEPFQESQLLSSVYDQTSQFLSYMNDAHTLKDLCQLVAKGTRDLTGYDRVMVYRFDRDYNGEVFAESCAENLEPFLGLHYPHTDIPAQARELYMQNLLRLIVDMDYRAVPIYTLDEPEHPTLDLSLSVLRSTSPIHIQYLQNMGVGATLTISLIHQKKLWGLIACHHYSPKNLSPEIRLAAQLQGHFLTSQIDIRQSNEEYGLTRKSHAALNVMNSLHPEQKKDFFQHLVSRPEMLAICNASGVSIQFGQQVFTNGLTPSEKEIRELSQWLYTYTDGTQLATDKLAALLPNAQELAQNASGLLYFSLGIQPENSIIWYRPETVTEVNWAGDPRKAIEKDQNGLSPRKSFELWKEFVKNQSKPWLLPEQASASNYAQTLQRHMNLILLTEEMRRNHELNEMLRETNSELENINWISTHDLQEPLRKIQLIASRILSKEEEALSSNVLDSLKRMNNSANRMQTLLIDILKYTKIQHSQAAFERIPTEKLVQEALADLQELISEKQALIEIDTLPDIFGVPFLLKQLFSNLISNALKYSHSDRAPILKISARENQTISNKEEKSYDCIVFSDNGIGFEPEFSETIFNIFTRLHSHLDYKGSGVGLALCKKIMQNHKGHITAKGELGKGAEFVLYFPKGQDQ